MQTVLLSKGLVLTSAQAGEAAYQVCWFKCLQLTPLLHCILHPCVPSLLLMTLWFFSLCGVTQVRFVVLIVSASGFRDIRKNSFFFFCSHMHLRLWVAFVTLSGYSANVKF